MSVKGTFMITLSGPPEAREAALAAFAEAYIAARPVGPAVAGADEEAKGWIEARFHEGTDSPSVEFQQACIARVTATGEPFGYEHRGHGVTIAGAAGLVYIVDKRTDTVVVKSLGLPPLDALTAVSEESGIPLEFLEVREPPGLWDVPDA